MGGQAVMEGVMMRGARTWAVAVRTPEGEIEIEVHDAPTWAERWAKIPLLRGVMALAESLALGFKALAWSANRQIPEEERISSKAMGWTMGVALAFFTAHLHRAARARGQRHRQRLRPRRLLVPRRRGRACAWASSSATCCSSAMPKDIKRVFQYHGAEHKAIAAYENDVELTAGVGAAVHTPARALRHQLPAHRDGVTIVVYSFVGRPRLPLLDRCPASC